jgi:hypothetical protein
MRRFSLDLETLWMCLKFVWVIPLLGIILVFGADIKFNELGPFGDFIAGTTVPLLTLVSFLAIVVTLRMQKEQLEMQRQELQNSIEEMRATRREFEEQNKTMAIQRFETTFFNMVNLHNEIVKSMVVNEGYGEIGGRKVFSALCRVLSDEYSLLLHTHRFNGKPEIERIRMAYNEFFESRESILGHYFRNLYRIVKFVDEFDRLSFKEKKTYIGIIKAQLSSDELVLLFYNSLSTQGTKFLPLIRKYNLLDNLNQQSLILASHYKVFQEYDEE